MRKRVTSIIASLIAATVAGFILAWAGAPFWAALGFTYLTYQLFRLGDQFRDQS